MTQRRPQRSAALVVLSPEHLPSDVTPRLGLPATRADCIDGPRPCPYVRCRHHLWTVTARDRPGRPRRGGKRRLTVLYAATEATCTLDAIDANPDGMGTRQVGELLGITMQRVRDIVRSARAKLEDALAEQR